MSGSKKSSNNTLAMTLLKGRTFIVLIVLLIFFSITADNFMNMNTVLLIGKHVALYGILAIGMTYVIITGGIDLSVGAIVGLGGMIAGGLLQNGLMLKMFGVTLYFSVPMVVLITLLIGALIGVINGLIITKFNVAPFIATLGMMYVARGIANIHSNGATYSDLKGYEGLGNQGWGFFGSNVAGIPVGLLILIVLAVFFALLLKRTAFGWHVFSIGGNEKAAKLSGVKVDKVKIFVYMISGICSAMVAVIASSQLAASHRGCCPRRDFYGRRYREHWRDHRGRVRYRRHQRRYGHVRRVRILADGDQGSGDHTRCHHRPIPEEPAGKNGPPRQK